MDDTIYKIAIAGFLHDIGKFAERADMQVENSYLDNNAFLYQPSYQGRYSHKHAVYTAAFIEKYESLLPMQFNKAGWGLGDSFINLAAMHHKPETPLQWIIAIADRVSSGFDRQEFEDYNKEIKAKDYIKTRLLPLLEAISLENNFLNDSLDSYKYRYPLKELSPNNVFPSDASEYRLFDEQDAKNEYKQLFDEFINALEKLWHKENIPLWFEHFENLFMIYTSHIPAATVGLVIPDVSLYDHAKTTAALASALYLYHKANGSLDEIDSIKSYDEKKFLLVNGDFYGIQDFIFTGGGSTGKASAKLLRGRSFSVSLLSELAADMLCREIGIPTSSIILNAAGKFTIIGPNTDKTKEVIGKVQTIINDWLIKNFYGQSSMGISFIEASCYDFVSGRFPTLWEKLQDTMDMKKYNKFDLSKIGGPVVGYLDSFNNSLDHPLCPFCGKRPSHKDATVKLRLDERESACKICTDHIYIGEHLVKNEKIAITTINADIHGDKLLEPLFGIYQLSFDVEGKLSNLAKSGSLLKYWDITIKKDGKLSKEITTKFINGYVPKYSEEDNYDDRLLAGKKRDETKLDLIDMIKEGFPKTFLHIAKKALYTDTINKFKGIEALGVLKADVDNLGSIFSYGIPEKRQTLSRIAALSRQLNNFFTVYLPYLLSTDDNFKDIYTVFAGGDDLFLIGPWNRIIEFSAVLNEKFEKYVCKNKDITLSAGITIHKPNTPVMAFAEHSEKALHESKSTSKKNCITIFNETVTWDEFNKLNEIKDTLEYWFTDGIVNNAMLFRLNEFIAMAKKEKEIQKASYIISMEDMECLKWRARLKYSVIRNVGKKLTKEEEKEKAIDEVMVLLQWLDKYRGGMKIPLWQILYNNR